VSEPGTLSDLIRLHPADTVAVCRRAVEAGELLHSDAGALAALDQIPQGHKIALVAHRGGDPVVKYGRPIGTAIHDIEAGSHVHVHNLRTVRGLAEPAR
jgi:altronate hydrolase